MAFRFKRFSVDDDQSTIRVGTDAILLGAWVDVSSAGTILDVGTGCGVIALMMAQRSEALITAIDVHQPSVLQSNANFNASPWSDRLSVRQTSFQEHSDSFPGHYDLILSNPPYFTGSLKSPVDSRNLAKHDDTLSAEDFFRSARKLFSAATNGSVAVIIPALKSNEFCSTAALHGFSLLRKMLILPHPGKPANRVTLQFSVQPVLIPEITQLLIRGVDNLFTSEYKELTRDFYLNF
jgi:tRNA1Val (adenine37-N6)-methyltransferase